MKYTYNYPRPSVTTDTIIFNQTNETIQILLIQRKKEPFKGMWATPGGFLNMDETGEEGAKRELLEETGLPVETLFFSHIADGVNRDPRGRIISLIYFTIIKDCKIVIKANDDACNAQWFNLFKLPDLACDHKENIQFVSQRMHEILQLQYKFFIENQFSSKDLRQIEVQIAQFLEKSNYVK